MASVITFLQVHQQLISTFVLALIAFVGGLHPAFDNSPLVQFLVRVLGGTPPAPPSGTPSAPAA